LLDVPKARLRATLNAFGQDWVEDPSNRNSTFERVRTRALLRHLQNQGIRADRLAAAARSCAQVRHVLERAAEALIARSIRGKDPLCLDREIFLSAPVRVREVALSMLLASVGGNVYPPSPAKLERLSNWLAHAFERSGAGRTLSGCEVRLKRDNILILPEGPRKSLKVGGNSENKCQSTLALNR
jgi:tRNA(Ile)-lysidine synthase